MRELPWTVQFRQGSNRRGSSKLYEAGFAANLYDDEGRTAGIFNIRYYPELLLSQTDAAAASPAETKELDEGLREQMETGLAHSGRLVHWTGTIKQVVNNKTVFLTDYVRESARRGTRFRVRLVRAFNEKKSFTTIISYRLDMEVLLAPICDRVISSLRF